MEIPWQNAQHLVSPLEMLAIINNTSREMRIEKQQQIKEKPRKWTKVVKQGKARKCPLSLPCPTVSGRPLGITVTNWHQIEQVGQ